MYITVVSGSLDPWTTPDRPDWSGRARHLGEVVDTLAAGGHHVDAVAPGDPSIAPPRAVAGSSTVSQERPAPRRTVSWRP